MSSSSPASRFAAVTKHDTNPFPLGECRALYVGTGGSIVARDAASGTLVTFANVPGGAILPIETSVVTTASTAADIVALY